MKKYKKQAFGHLAPGTASMNEANKQKASTGVALLVDDVHVRIHTPLTH